MKSTSDIIAGIKALSAAALFLLLALTVIFWVPVHYAIGNSDLKKCYRHVSDQYPDHWHDSFWADSNRFTRRHGSNSYTAFVYQNLDFSKESVTYVCDWNAPVDEDKRYRLPNGEVITLNSNRPKIQVLEGNQLDRINRMTWSTATPLGYLHVTGRTGRK